MEYKQDHYLWHQFRPQATFFLSHLGSGYVGAGIGWELYLTKHILINPSFSPGIYWKGKGKNLGYPLEFRSALEISYERNHFRLGIQIFHVSNAHLSRRNPGLNALTVSLAIPFSFNFLKVN